MRPPPVILLCGAGAGVNARAPSQPLFMPAIFHFDEDAGGRTHYAARLPHWSAADREAHEKMGFHEGWGKCADQLAALVARL